MSQLLPQSDNETKSSNYGYVKKEDKTTLDDQKYLKNLAMQGVQLGPVLTQEEIYQKVSIMNALKQCYYALQLCECELSMYKGLAQQSNNPKAWYDAIDQAQKALNVTKEWVE